jgi:hypothetical protein
MSWHFQVANVVEEMEELINEDTKFTYFAIGSVFRDLDINLSPQLDQVYPTFLKSHDSFMAIHYDPRFGDCWEFTDAYFAAKGFQKIGNQYVSGNKQFFIFSDYIEHDTLFFYNLAKPFVDKHKKLIVQDFTGRLLNDLCIQVYYSFPEVKRKVFRENVLFDMTCGNASCMTDMNTTFPIMDKLGNFLNFVLIPPHELVGLINYDPKLDVLIEEVYKKEYKKILNEEHTNYRRRMNGDVCLFPKAEYGMGEDPVVIMQVMVNKLLKVVDVRKRFGFDEKRFSELVNTHQNYDMYKWYGLMNAL